MKSRYQDPLVKKLIVRGAIANIVLTIIWRFAIEDPMPWVKGQVLGGLVSILMFWQMKLTLEKALVKSPQQASNQVRRGYMIRMVFYGIIFILSILSPDISLFTVIIGVVSMKYIVLISGILDKKIWDKRPGNHHGKEG